MGTSQFRVGARWPMLLAAMLAICSFTFQPASAQIQSGSSVTVEQQKQLERVNQLSEQLRKDRAAVDAAVKAHGWDSNEADAAQQRLFQDRQEYRNLRQSLQVAGVSVLPDAKSGGTGNQATQSGHCCSHGHGHHSCCEGEHDCCGNHGGCGDSGDHCCHGQGD